jgi:hypothetical protein
MILPSGFVRLLESEFVKQVEAFSKLADPSSATWHQAKLSKFKRDWLTMRSTETCFACNMARPQYRLPCGHIVCDNCVRKFGTQTDVWNFNVPYCFLCLDASGINIKVKPPTATPRLLSIDGGGVRGIIPLIFLQALEEMIGLPYPVQGNFHFIYGTSSG